MYPIAVSMCFMAILGMAVATDYCSSSLCGGSTHIACGNNGQFASSCPSNAALVDINPYKSYILDYHNEKRNLIAGGTVANHDAACRMATTQWDDELAKLAALNVRQCKMAHDKCRNTDTFHYAGQNLAYRTYSGSPKYEELLKITMDMWYDEVSLSNMGYINSYPSAGVGIGHFTVMVNEKNIRVGCAAATYGTSKQTFLIACNYARTNVATLPTYTSCGTPGSSCASGKNSKYPNLCSESESYDPNNLS
ncbi:antigen 5 like allergen Cul n 1 [Stomoxys calcitrans]|uniref:antigen 5 like allergen Cul n 1 n=1 Tax=Stomoxys calcitrans TaxID=35570 RepID=UPI0027E31D79|nr:antigen 5 like allergen Cul n 1 [Stomoxys calcitrans]